MTQTDEVPHSLIMSAREYHNAELAILQETRSKIEHLWRCVQRRKETAVSSVHDTDGRETFVDVSEDEKA